MSKWFNQLIGRRNKEQGVNAPRPETVKVLEAPEAGDVVLSVTIDKNGDYKQWLIPTNPNHSIAMLKYITEIVNAQFSGFVSAMVKSAMSGKPRIYKP